MIAKGILTVAQQAETMRFVLNAQNEMLTAIGRGISWSTEDYWNAVAFFQIIILHTSKEGNNA